MGKLHLLHFRCFGFAAPSISRLARVGGWWATPVQLVLAWLTAKFITTMMLESNIFLLNALVSVAKCCRCVLYSKGRQEKTSSLDISACETPGGIYTACARWRVLSMPSWRFGAPLHKA